MIQKIRETQKTHLLNMFGNVIDAQSLTKDEAQVIITHGNQLKEDLFKTTRDFVQRALWQGNNYPKDYRRKPVERQVNILASVFDLSTDETMKFVTERLPNIKLPRHAEGWFAIPSIEAVAKKHFPQVTGDIDQYRECIRFVCKKVKDTRVFSDYGLGYFNHHSFMERPKSLNAFGWMGGQKGEIIIIPAQLGMRYQGKSINDALQAFRKEEFPLGMFEVLSILLTHPKRLGIYSGLGMTCADNAISNDGVPKYPHFWMDSTEPSWGDRINFQNRLNGYDTQPYYAVLSGFKF
jgi:hypothetical protein